MQVTILVILIYGIIVLITIALEYLLSRLKDYDPKDQKIIAWLQPPFILGTIIIYGSFVGYGLLIVYVVAMLPFR